MDATAGSDHRVTPPWWPVLLVPALGLALAASGAALSRPVLSGRTPAGPSRGHPDPELLIGLAAAALGCAVVVVWSAAAALAVLAVLARRHRWERLGRLCGRWSPALLRRAAAAALGLQLVAAQGAVADEAPSPFWSGSAAVHGVPGSFPGAPAPRPAPGPGTAPTGSSATAPPAAPPPETAPPGKAPPVSEAPAPEAPSAPLPAPAGRTVDGAVTVLRGDTLWSLAAAQLGPEASDEQIARAWPAWYELNRHVLPCGPHLLRPGQRLVVPGPGDR
ncbi:LysM peptidoglycan-binding domain-containing protein [Kocuria sp. CPCC 205300]|uniref:LysM peptidoglycan-binding domain-containing protein n=1 Tax=Kocuria sabuli TaxID=3071448 RepID=UPI0036DF6C48